MSRAAGSSADEPGQQAAARVWEPCDQAREQGGLPRHDEFGVTPPAGIEHGRGEPLGIELLQVRGAAGGGGRCRQARAAGVVGVAVEPAAGGRVVGRPADWPR